jgi:hypothetical protein
MGSHRGSSPLDETKERYTQGIFLEFFDILGKQSK